MQTHKVFGVSRASIGVAVALAVVLIGSYAFAATTSSLVPTADGFYTQWTPSTGTSHFALVDEAPCNSTDSVSTTVAGNRDSYATDISSVPNGATITKVDIKPCAARVATGGTNPVMNVFYRLNGINSSDAGAYSLGSAILADLATTSISVSSVIKSATTTFETGTVLTSGTKGAKLSRIATLITFTTLGTPSGLSGSAFSAIP